MEKLLALLATQHGFVTEMNSSKKKNLQLTQVHKAQCMSSKARRDNLQALVLAAIAIHAFVIASSVHAPMQVS